MSIGTTSSGSNINIVQGLNLENTLAREKLADIDAIEMYRSTSSKFIE